MMENDAGQKKINQESQISENKSTDDIQSDKFYQHVISRLRSNIHPEQIEKELVNMGLPKTDTDHVIRDAEKDLNTIQDSEQFNLHTFMIGILGGVLAALIGGFVWGLILVHTGFEVGYVAWGIGWITGYSVLLITGGKRGYAYQGIAAATSILGIIIGKYYYFIHLVKKEVLSKYGKIAEQEVSFFSEKAANIFIEEFTSIVTGFDLIWVGLAVFTAWKIPMAILNKINDSNVN